MPRLIGLTGGIASGKSTVGRLLAEQHGAVLIDADQVARQVVEPGQPALAALVEALGSGILTADGQLDRAAMRQRISEEPATRSTLEGITHPAIRDAMLGQVQRAFGRGAELVVVEAALLVETGSYKHYPELWVVSCSEATQLERLVGRDGMSEEAARKLIATQLPAKEKEAVATTVIRNDGSAEDLAQAVARALAR